MILRPARLIVAAGLLAATGLFAQNAPLPQTVRPVTPTGPSGQPPVTAPAPIPMADGDEMIPFVKMADLDIDSVLEALHTYTGRVIVHPPQLAVTPGGFSLKIDRPMPKSEVVLAIETLLELSNIGVVPADPNLLKVVNLTQARTETPEFIEGSTLRLPSSDRIATKLFQLSYLREEEFFNQGLFTMLSPGIGGGVVPFPKANAAMVTDTISNLQRIEKLITAVDHPNPGGFGTLFYKLHYAKPSELVTKIHSLLTGPSAMRIGTSTAIQADDSTSQILILCDVGEKPFFDDIISKLDVKTDSGTRNEVIYLKHADAKDLTTTLTALVNGQSSAAQKVGATVSREQPGNVSVNGAPAPGMVVAPASAARTAAEAAGETEFSALMTIEPDERSNSIVVSGTENDIALLRELIDKLDAAVPQVRIQVIIAEVTLSDKDVSGITSLGLTVGQRANGSTAVTQFAGGGSNTAIPGTSVAGFDLSNGIVNPLSFNAALNATSAGGKNLVHILQAAVIVTAHAKKGEMTVGQQVPIINGGQSTVATTGTTPVNSFNSTYQTVAVDLTVTPLVGDNGDIQLDMDQKVDDIAGETTIQAGDTQPIISHQEAKSYVTVKSGQMVVLGGLQKTNKSSNHNKIGFLYEIPILSQLLGGHTDDLERTELLFFIRPVIVTPEDGSADTVHRIDEMSNREQIHQFLENPAPQPDSKVHNFLDRFKE